MWFNKSLVYKFRYGKLPLKMHILTEKLLEDCRKSIKEEFKVITAKMPHILSRLNRGEANQRMHSYFVDILGRSHPVKQPIFASNELTKLVRIRFTYVVLIFLMISFESLLYSPMASLFICKHSVNPVLFL